MVNGVQKLTWSRNSQVLVVLALHSKKMCILIRENHMFLSTFFYYVKRGPRGPVNSCFRLVFEHHGKIGTFLYRSYHGVQKLTWSRNSQVLVVLALHSKKMCILIINISSTLILNLTETYDFLWSKCTFFYYVKRGPRGSSWSSLYIVKKCAFWSEKIICFCQIKY
jgi:hypothetical protein